MKRSMFLLFFVSLSVLAIGQKKSHNYGDLLKILEGKINVVYDSLKYNEKMDSLYPGKRVGNKMMFSSYLMKRMDLEAKMDTLKKFYIDLLEKRQVEIGDSILVDNLLKYESWNVKQPLFNPSLDYHKKN